uniref:Nuclease (SNase-like) n=1 Tax=Rhodopseudomonas palustris (strain BisA53) TaxID=316055 RepID=Q07VF1_RHOP5
MPARRTLWLMTLLIAGAGDALATGCRLAPQGEGRVAAIVDAVSFRLEDGREVKLAGLARLATRRDQNAAALADLVQGREVTLHGTSDMPDRYGRQPALVYRRGDEVSLQALLLGTGDAVASGDLPHRDCRAELAEAERRARVAGHGFWGEPTALKNPEKPGDIVSGIGRFTLVEGRVVSVREAGATLYLNFGHRWTRDFAVTISRRDAAAFEAAGVALKSLERRRILVRGVIEKRRGPQIEIRQVGQIELVGDR